MSTPFWTAREGVIGTAHLNRDGIAVNFLPARAPRADFQFKIGTRLVFVVLEPHRGIAIDPLMLPATVSRAPAPLSAHCDPALWATFEDLYEATFEGVATSVTYTTDEPLETLEARAIREASSAKIEAENARRAVARDRFCALTAQEWIDAAAPTAREWGRLASPAPGRAFRVFCKIHDRVATALGCEPRFWIIDSVSIERIRGEMLVIRETQRREAKTRHEFAGQSCPGCGYDPIGGTCPQCSP